MFEICLRYPEMNLHIGFAVALLRKRVVIKPMQRRAAGSFPNSFGYISVLVQSLTAEETGSSKHRHLVDW